MHFSYNFNVEFNTTPLYAAVEKENSEIIKLLLAYDKLDINSINILLLLIYEEEIQIMKFYNILKYIIYLM